MNQFEGERLALYMQKNVEDKGEESSTNKEMQTSIG